MNKDCFSTLLPVLEKYPDLNITQLGLVVLYIGAIRAKMGHEHAKSTIRDYIHKEMISDLGVVKCLDFLEREIISLRKSRIDIDIWKTGNKSCPRDD